MDTDVGFVAELEIKNTASGVSVVTDVVKQAMNLGKLYPEYEVAGLELIGKYKYKVFLKPSPTVVFKNLGD